MAKYAECECAHCHMKIPKNEARQYSEYKTTGRSSGSRSVYYGKKGYQGVRYTSGRTYQKKVDFWLCSKCASAYEDRLAAMMKLKLFLGVAAAVVIAAIYFSNGSEDVSRQAKAPPNQTEKSVSAAVGVPVAPDSTPNLPSAPRLSQRNGPESLDPDSNMVLSNAIVRNLQQARDGEATAWNDPKSGASGTVRSYAEPAINGQACRTFSYVARDNEGREVTQGGQGCRMANGNWLIR